MKYSCAVFGVIVAVTGMFFLVSGCVRRAVKSGPAASASSHGPRVAVPPLPPGNGSPRAPAITRSPVREPKPAASGYINTWLVLGPFPNDARDVGLDHPWIDENKAAPEADASAGGHKWRYFDDRLFSRNYDNYQDMFSYFHIERHESVAGVVAYAHVYLYTPRAQNAHLFLAADTSSKAWLNGKVITRFFDGSGNRQANITDIRLQAGWNSLLLKIANTEDGRFGFYARVCGRKGGNPLELTISPNGPGDGKLRVETSAMAAIESPNMPVGWCSWPYVGAHVHLNNPVFDGFNGGPLAHFLPDRNDMLQASNFRFTAQGGTPPYVWMVGTGGGLPPGLALRRDGTITGTISSAAKLGDYHFRVWVRDATGKLVSKDISITVRLRPDKWYEEARLVGLMEATNELSRHETNDYAKILKRRGYQVIIVNAFNNGGERFHYPSRFSKVPIKKDAVARWKAAIEGQGMKFGLYMGNITNIPGLPFPNNQALLMVLEAVRRYHPAVLWLDWSGINAISPDAIFSAVRTLDPNLLIVLNGSVRGSNGDWDEICFEGWGAWGKGHAWNIWPTSISWPIKNSPEGWRLMVEPGFSSFNPGNVRSSWRQMLRIQNSLIGEGFVADIDAIPGLVNRRVPLSQMRLAANQRQMAAWTSPPGLPPLYPSFTQVNPGPLRPASWGYDTINLPRDTIYLHLLKNPLGKTGLPDDSTLTIRPLTAKVKDVVWMNTNQPLKFIQHHTQTDHGLTIDIADVKPDPVDTIIRIDLDHPLPKPTLAVQRAVPIGNLAYKKPAWLLSADGSHEVIPSCYMQYASNGVDGNLLTSAEAGGEWAWTYEVDLRRLCRVRRIIVAFPAHGYATEYNLLLSVGGRRWRQVAHVHARRGGFHESLIKPTLARYVRVQAVKPDGPGQPGGQMTVAELQVFAADKKP